MSEPMLDATTILDKTRALQRRFASSDQTWNDVRLAREGNLDAVFPDLVSTDWPKPIIANYIDTIARDLTEMIAPLPSFNCTSTTMGSDKARKFADKRSKIALHYSIHSRLGLQMMWGADHYITYGRTCLYIEPDLEARMPRVLVEDPTGSYIERDRWGRVVRYIRRYYTEAAELAAEFPEYATQITKAAKDAQVVTENQVELVRYCDADQVTLVLVAQHPEVLMSVRNRLDECPVAVVDRPWLDNKRPHGQFNDVIWIQLARDVLAKLNLEMTEKAVQAPLALPQDVQELPYGPDAVLRTSTPEKIRRVGLELPQMAFAEEQVLLEELRQGARYPAARTGGVQASVITGKGIEALLGGFNSQIATAQLAFADGFREMHRLCFLMDEKLWPNAKKDIRGNAAGTPYEISYTPSKDIAGDHTVDVSYGFASGLQPNQAVVMMLQLRAEKAISRDFFMRQLPFDLNISEQTTQIEIEEFREALMQGMFAYAQSVPAMVQQGMDPSDPIQKLTAVVHGLQRGKAIEEVVADAFTPQPPPQPPEGAPEAPMGPGGGPGPQAGPGGLSGGLTASGLMRGVAPGQAGMAPGGRPDLSVLLSGMTAAGKPEMSAFTARRRRA